MIEQIQFSIWLPTFDFVIELITAYFLIGFMPWFIWCASEVWCDYGRKAKTIGLVSFLVVIYAWAIWSTALRQAKGNFSYQKWNRDWKYYR